MLPILAARGAELLLAQALLQLYSWCTETATNACCTQKSQNSTDNDLLVEERLIPYEPSYIVMNLAMSNNAWAKVDPNLKYPGVMSVDWVRVWQHPNKINVGCDAPGFPTSQYISCNRHLYLPDNERGMWKLPWCKEVTSGVSWVTGRRGMQVICNS